MGAETSASPGLPGRCPVVTVCTLTYRRPAGIARLLEGLAAQQFKGPPPDVRLVVVDNDPAGGAHDICRQFAGDSPWPLEYVIEPRRGIAFARNAALDQAHASEWIAFIDDDEVPARRWLDELLCVQRRLIADVVAGPVVPHFPDAVPDWVIEGGFFERRRYPTGQRLPHAFTNNVLFRGRILEELQLRFNERWALMGCEDRAFFQTIGMAGYRIVWADEAAVTEWIPASRATADWLLRRYYRVGNATSLVELDLRPRWKMAPLLLARSVAWLGIGLFRLLGSALGGPAARLRGRQACAYGAGLLTGLLGKPYEEYRQTHGD